MASMDAFKLRFFFTCWEWNLDSSVVWSIVTASFTGFRILHCETTHMDGFLKPPFHHDFCSSYQIFAGIALCVLIKGFSSLDLTSLCHLRKWPEIGTKEEWLLQ